MSEFSNVQKQNKNKLYESISKTLTQASIFTTFPQNQASSICEEEDDNHACTG